MFYFFEIFSSSFSLEVGDFVEDVLEFVVGDPFLEGGDEGLCFFGGFAAEGAYERGGMLEVGIGCSLSGRDAVDCIRGRTGDGGGKERNVPSWALSNLDSCVAELSRRSTASTFSFLVNRAKLSR